MRAQSRYFSGALPARLRGARSVLRPPFGRRRRSTNAIMMCERALMRAEVWFEAGERIRTRRALTP